MYSILTAEEMLKHEKLKDDEGLVILRFTTRNIPIFKTEINDLSGSSPEDYHSVELLPKPIMIDLKSQADQWWEDGSCILTKKYPNKKISITGYPIKVKLGQQYYWDIHLTAKLSNIKNKYDIYFIRNFKLDTDNRIYMIDAEIYYDIISNTISYSLIADEDIEIESNKFIYVPHKVIVKNDKVSKFKEVNFFDLRNPFYLTDC